MSLAARITDLAAAIAVQFRALRVRVETLEAEPDPTFKTVNGQVITGSGNILTTVSFATDAEAAAFSTANPGVTVGSRQV